MATEEMAPAPPEEVQTPVDIEHILEDYRRREMLEHLAGPIISVVFHAVVLTVAFVFMGSAGTKTVSAIEVEMKEMEVKELDQKVVEELQRLEEQIQDVVPTVERPVISTQEASEAVAAVTSDFSDAMAQTDNAMDFSDVLDIKASSTPLKIAGIFGGRTNEGRAKARKAYGGTGVAESAVLKALRWLKEHQEPSGAWSKTSPDAMTGLGLLTFLAHGETPTSEEFGPTVQKAMQFLTERMMAVPEGTPGGLAREYANGIATYALSESYGLTKIPFLKPAMEKGLTFIVKGQQQNTGGWDYGYAKGKRWDMSVSGWQIQALKAGVVAGAEVPGLHETVERAANFVKKVSFKDGRFGYSSPGGGSWGIQGAGTLCLQLIGEGNCSEARAGVKNISENDKVVWEDDREFRSHSNPAYNWYYETQAMFHAGTSTWSKWNKVFSTVIIEHQKADGHWDCPGKKSDRPEYDPYYTTCLCALSLQVYYRYLPTYKLPKAVHLVEALPRDTQGKILKRELRRIHR